MPDLRFRDPVPFSARGENFLDHGHLLAPQPAARPRPEARIVALSALILHADRHVGTEGTLAAVQGDDLVSE
ncbi:MAG: hypothetical protein ACRDJ9_29625, partial [Dehalococcoidia bacterium]